MNCGGDLLIRFAIVFVGAIIGNITYDIIADMLKSYKNNKHH